MNKRQSLIDTLGKVPRMTLFNGILPPHPLSHSFLYLLTKSPFPPPRRCSDHRPRSVNRPTAYLAFLPLIQRPDRRASYTSHLVWDYRVGATDHFRYLTYADCYRYAGVIFDTDFVCGLNGRMGCKGDIVFSANTADRDDLIDEPMSAEGGFFPNETTECSS
jgi:hypothetical protein